MTNNETPRSLPCLIRSVHPHLLADSIECNPSFVEPTCRDFDGRLIALDDQVTINSATLDTEFVASSIVGTVVGFRNGLLLVQSTRTGGTEEVRPVRTRVIVTETTTTEATAHEITIVTDGEGNCTAHGAGCRDLTQPRNNRRLGNQETRTYASKREVVETVYGGFEDLEDNHDGWAAFAAHEGFRFMPCCGDLPDETATVEVEPVVEQPEVEPTSHQYTADNIAQGLPADFMCGCAEGDMVPACEHVAPVEVVDVDGTPITVGARVDSMSIFGAFESGDSGTVRSAVTTGEGVTLVTVDWDFGKQGVEMPTSLRVAPAAAPSEVVEDAQPMIVDRDGRPISIGDRVESVPPLGPGTVERFASEGRALVRWDDAGQLGVYRACWLKVISPARPAPAAPMAPININGQTVWLGAGMLDTLRSCIARAAGHTVVGLDRGAARELFELLAAPLSSAQDELADYPTDGG